MDGDGLVIDVSSLTEMDRADQLLANLLDLRIEKSVKLNVISLKKCISIEDILQKH
jgi:hypothetical protein